MKIAIIITGQPRTWKLCKYFFKNMINDNYDCDVFLSIDANSKTQLLYQNNRDNLETSEVKEIINFYNPITYYVSNLKSEEEINDIIKTIPTGKIFGHDCNDSERVNIYNYLINQNTQYNKWVNDQLKINNTYFKSPTTNKIEGHLYKKDFYGLIRQYFFVSKAYELVKEHIIKTDVKYDLVIRMRFDHVAWDDTFYDKELYTQKNIKYTQKNIKLAEILTQGKITTLDTSEVNTIKVSSGGVFQNYTYVNDFFWTHGHDIIYKMALFGHELKNIICNSIKTGWPVHGAAIEHFISVFLFNKNINIKPTIMDNMTIVREFETAH